jgi:hypothetical protein
MDDERKRIERVLSAARQAGASDIILCELEGRLARLLREIEDLEDSTTEGNDDDVE